jgi:hypothetical protein
LVEYVMKRDENIAQKIELLLKDGYVLSLFLSSPTLTFFFFSFFFFFAFCSLYEQCISIFPKPSVSEDPEELDKQINLLQKLFEEVDRHSLPNLEKLIPGITLSLPSLFLSLPTFYVSCSCTTVL